MCSAVGARMCICGAADDDDDAKDDDVDLETPALALAGRRRVACALVGLPRPESGRCFSVGGMRAFMDVVAVAAAAADVVVVVASPPRL